jgi:hypothetical protein
MRRLALLALVSLLPLGSAKSQVVVRGGFDIGVRLPRIVRVQIGHRGPSHRPHRVDTRSRGHWEVRQERVWVEPAYEYRRDACGRYYRVCVGQGHWTYVERRVWVQC